MAKELEEAPAASPRACSGLSVRWGKRRRRIHRARQSSHGTIPPFSLFREFVSTLVEHDKKFFIIGNVNSVTYKDFFPPIKENKVWPAYSFNKTMFFSMPESYTTTIKECDAEGRKPGKVPSIAWFTNLDIKKRHEPLILTERYDAGRYPRYDNHDAIGVPKVSLIPADYKPCWLDCPAASGCEFARGKGDGGALCETV